MAEIRYFGDFELDRSACCLSREGQTIHLERIPFDLLFLLVERRGQLVTREEILERIWGKGVFIDSENAINTAIRKIRRALNDTTGAPRFIVTVPAKGYRFAAPVLISNGEPTTNEGNNQLVDGSSADFPLTPAVSHEGQTRRYGYWSIGTLSVASVALIATAMITVLHWLYRARQPSVPKFSTVPVVQLPDKPSIAVLPFINLSRDQEQEYFSHGITDDLITALSRLPGLLVIARGSSFTYKGKASKLRDVGRDLGVRYVLEGSVRKAAERVRITVQLADATTDTELWAEQYDRPLHDVFTLQDEIVRRIVTTLNLQLALSQRHGLVIARSTDNFEAYDYLLRGAEYLFSLSRDGNAKAREMFEKAIELDPKYSVARVFLGFTYYLGWGLGLNPDPGGLERAQQITQQAIALDDSLAFAHSILAMIYIHNGQNAHMYDHNWQTDQALTEAEKAVALDPNSAFGYSALAEILNMQGKNVESLAAAEKAMRLDPRNRVNYMWAEGQAYTGLERWEQAASSLKTYLQHNPDNLWAHVLAAIDYFNLHDRERAGLETSQVEKLAVLSPSAQGYSTLAMPLNAQGRPAEALLAAKKGMRFDSQNPTLLSSQGWAYAQLGRWKEGVAAWKRYVDLYPNDIGARSSLAVLYSASGEMDAAREEVAQVERAVALDPDTSYGYRVLAMALNATGRPADALAATEKAMDLYPLSDAFPPYPICEQGRAYAQLGRWQESIRALKSCLAHHSTEQALPHIGLAVDYIEFGQDNAARAEVADILKLDPQFSLKRALETEFPAHREFAANLSKAGLK
ncbi:MAG TPA: winged helix-turn-helix domain-containing protein [Candidatus Binataceae bacterium]|nr:winged helix-turn-helix domain-containing protein [Candidatus Binataceae bacterium]